MFDGLFESFDIQIVTSDIQTDETLLSCVYCPFFINTLIRSLDNPGTTQLCTGSFKGCNLKLQIEGKRNKTLNIQGKCDTSL